MKLISWVTVGLSSSLLLALTGCVTVPLHERDLLADRIMVFDADPLGTQLRSHMITPREGAIGGFSATDAGGCSCK